MKVGNNIKDIREVEKNFKRSYVAERLGITTRAYANIENNLTEITIKRLDEIAEIFECSPLYILNHQQTKNEFYNHFHNYKGNLGVNIMSQSIQSTSNGMIQKLQEELLASERNRIALLEALLRNNNIEF
jgi:transcriptional regulator with XRE-family HTH domain